MSGGCGSCCSQATTRSHRCLPNSEFFWRIVCVLTARNLTDSKLDCNVICLCLIFLLHIDGIIDKFQCIRSLSDWRSKYFLHGIQAFKVVARFAIINQVFLLFVTGVGVVFDRLGTLLWWRCRRRRVVSFGVWHDGKSGGGSAASCSWHHGMLLLLPPKAWIGNETGVLERIWWRC